MLRARCLRSSPPRLPPASPATASPVTWGGVEFVTFAFVLAPQKHQDGGRGGVGGDKSTDSSLPLFNLTRQAALGTFQSIFKLTIYNQFSRGDGDGDEVEESPCCCGRCGAGWGVGEMGIQRRVVRGVSR